jgi:aminoglycoside phosphotransferase (APT) family kinase protein
MHEMDSERIKKAVISSLKQQLNVGEIKQIGSGNEFYIYRTDLESGPVVIKIPKDKVFSNVNDAFIDSKTLLDQEFALMRHVKSKGIKQIPKPLFDLDAMGFTVVVMSYVASDESKPDQHDLGVLLARLHSIVPPDISLSAQEHSEIPELISQRLARRWIELERLVPDMPSLLKTENLSQYLEPIRGRKKLLHMDFRQANFRMNNGKVVALLDWSNALVGHPALELARVAETGETNSEFLAGYYSVADNVRVDPMVETIFRLDTATMLALVFLSEEPNPELADVFIGRVRQLHNSLIEMT